MPKNKVRGGTGRKHKPRIGEPSHKIKVRRYDDYDDFEESSDDYYEEDRYVAASSSSGTVGWGLLGAALFALLIFSNHS